MLHHASPGGTTSESDWTLLRISPSDSSFERGLRPTMLTGGANPSTKYIAGNVLPTTNPFDYKPDVFMDPGPGLLRHRPVRRSIHYKKIQWNLRQLEI